MSRDTMRHRRRWIMTTPRVILQIVSVAAGSVCVSCRWPPCTRHNTPGDERVFTSIYHLCDDHTRMSCFADTLGVFRNILLMPLNVFPFFCRSACTVIYALYTRIFYD